MKRYILVDNESWVSSCLYHSLEDAIRRANKLLLMPNFRDTHHIHVYEADTKRDETMRIARVDRDGVVME